MRAFVFTDASLGRRAGQFVWLAIDTEKPGNAPLTKRLRVEALPMFFILDSKTEAAALRWPGGATVPQVQKFLDDGRRAVGGPSRGVEEILARADRAFAQGGYAAAAKLYRETLAAAPDAWPRYGRALESFLYALSSTKDNAGCARAAAGAWTRLAKTPSAANVASSGLSCALDMPAAEADRGKLVEEMRAHTIEIVRSGRTDFAADDVSGAFQTLEDDRERVEDAAGKTALLREHAAFLERQAELARTPAGRAVFDPHRLGAYLDLGEPERAVAMLELSEKDFPDDYNPPARLAVAYDAMKKFDDAAAASDRALARAYGPRKLGILQRRADIETHRGDAAAAKRYLEEAVRTAEALPEGQRSERTIAALKKKLEEPQKP
jgi:hypothetical protein